MGKIINVLLCETEGNDTYYTFAQIVIYNTINALGLPLSPPIDTTAITVVDCMVVSPRNCAL